MPIKSTDFRVNEGARVDLKKWPTRVRPSYKTGRQYKDMLAAHVKELSAQQELLYASNSYALLLIFQAAPWYIVPADDKPNARLIVSRILLDVVEALKLSYPKTNASRRRELRSLRKQLLEES